MKKAVAIVCICVFSFCLFANQGIQTQTASIIDQRALEYLLTIARYDKAIADKRVPWETEEEYMARVQTDGEAIQLTQQMNAYKKAFAREEYHIGFDKTEVKVLPFDAENKRFPIEITSKDDLLPFHATLDYKITTTDFEAIGREYSRIDTAYKANALAASIEYDFTEKFPNIWEIAFWSVSLYSQLESDSETQGLIATYQSNEMTRTNEKRLIKLQNGTIVPLYAVIPITVLNSKDASIFVDGTVIGVGAAIHVVTDATERVSITAESKTGGTGRRSISVTRGINQSVKIVLSREGMIGPAGGYIFYDKGYYSDGWQYLEAAPAFWNGGGGEPGYEFGYYRQFFRYKEVGTSRAIGSGKANTAALVEAMGHSAYTINKRGYAAKAASSYTVTVDGVTYNDWFLPSRDELDLMYTNLHKNGLGGFYDYHNYWSSSESGGTSAWAQVFYNGTREYIERSIEGKVRPVRAF